MTASNAEAHMYRNILLPVDLEEPRSWRKALPVAAAMCRCFDASLALATVVPNFRLVTQTQWSPIGYREMLDLARVELNSLADDVRDVGEVARYVEIGHIYAAVLALGARIDADMIVLASHRPAKRDYLLGTNAARIVRHAKCSVLVVRD